MRRSAVTDKQIEDIAGGGGGSQGTHIYSDDEHVVGKWLDGRAVYERTIHINGGGASGVFDIILDSVNYTLLSARGSALFTSGNRLAIPSLYFTLYQNTDGLKWDAVSATVSEADDNYITIEYLKNEIL